MSEFTVLPEIEQLLFPLAEEEFRLLKESIEREGIRDPPVVWDRKDDLVLLDGHHRLKIEPVKYPDPIRLKFGSLDEVLDWVDNNQLGRRNLTDEQRTMVTGRIYDRVVRRRENESRPSARRQLLETPEWSDRRVARAVDCDHMLVAAVRKELEDAGEIEKVEKREGGKKQRQVSPSKKKVGSKAQSEPQTSTSTRKTTTSTRKKQTGKSAKHVAETEDVSENTVKRAAAFTRAMDKLKPIDEDVYNRILRSEIRDAKTRLADLMSGKKSFVKKVLRQLDDSISKARKVVERAERVSKPSPFPEGVYDVIYADPPWKFKQTSSETRDIAKQQYSVLDTSEIASFTDPAGTPVQDIIADDAVLFLWTPTSVLEEALEVLHAWGFQYVTFFVWVKESVGMGWWLRNRHEVLLVGKRGKMPAPTESTRSDSVIEAPRRGRSRKPDEFYEIIEQMYPAAKRIELFGRHKRPGWDSWGRKYT